MRSRPVLSANGVVTRRENVQSDLEQAETAAKIGKRKKTSEKYTDTDARRERGRGRERERERITVQED
jgi:hypothetical protein